MSLACEICPVTEIKEATTRDNGVGGPCKLLNGPAQSIGQLGLLLCWAVQGGKPNGRIVAAPARPLRRPPVQTSPATCRLLACSFRPTVFALRPPHLCGLQQSCARRWRLDRRYQPSTETESQRPLPAWLVAYRGEKSSWF